MYAQLFLDYQNGPEWQLGVICAYLSAHLAEHWVSYETERYSIREMLKDQDKQLGNLEKDLNKLEKKNQNLHNDIQKAKEEILKKEREIEENLVMQGDKKKEIEKQRETIRETTKKLSNVGKS